MTAPVLLTERLRLRGHTLDDFESCASLWADPRVTRYITGKPFTREESWSRLLRYVGHWWMLGFGYWVAEEKSTGTYLGELGFADYKRDIDPPLQGMPEAGWVFATTAQGKGYATEGVRAITQWGDSHFGSKRTACLIDPENIPSLSIAAKCGYQEWQHTTYKGHPATIFIRESNA
jgi:RimJ/RimL family protein N-acetyltransferase